MNHFVPDFDTDHDSIIPSSFLPPSKSSAMAEEEDLMELLWHNGQVVFHNQTQLRPPDVKKSSPPPDLTPVRPPPPPPPPDHHSNLFIHENELASWLHYPLHHDDFSSDLLYSASPSQPQRISPTSTPERPKIPVSAPRPPERPKIPVSAPRPPVPPASRTVNETRAVRNFANFSRFRGKSTTGGRVESGQPSSSSAVERESDVTRRQGGGVDYGQPSSASAVKAVERESLTPTGSDMTRRLGGGVEYGQPSSASAAKAVERESLTPTGSDMTRRRDGADTRWTINGGVSSAASGGCAVATYDISGTSSWKGKAEQSYSRPETETTEIDGDRKRKGREAIVETESRSEETKQGRGSTSTKRSRAAEVHNLSERRRRDRINEKMRTLQELIPRCNKSDKASMLDEAIEYIKSLQLQVQMMSMGYSMTPMMYPGMQQYMAMGMGMGIGMNRPFMPFPNMLTTPSLPTMAAHMGASAFPTSPFPVPNFQVSDPSRVPVHSQQPDPGSNSLQPDPASQPLQPQMQQPDPASQPLQPQIQQPHPCFLDPYQQFLGLHPMQASMLQNQATGQPSSSKEPEDEENLPEG